MRKSQGSMEFIILAVFMLFIAISFFGVVSNKLILAKEEEKKQIAEDIASFVKSELDIARTSMDGYSRTFAILEEMEGIPYNLTVIDGRELVINYLGYEHVMFFPGNVTGNLSIGINRIKKENGVIILQNFSSLGSLYECSDTLDNDLDSKVDTFDSGCSSPLDKDESNCGDGACEGGETCTFCSSDCGSC